MSNPLDSIPDLLPSSNALLFWIFVTVTGVGVAQLSTKIAEWVSSRDEAEEMEDASVEVAAETVDQEQDKDL